MSRDKGKSLPRQFVGDERDCGAYERVKVECIQHERYDKVRTRSVNEAFNDSRQPWLGTLLENYTAL